MTDKPTPTDAEILDAAEDFRSQYTHGGTTFDEFDEIGFARAVLAKWGQPAQAAEPVAWLDPWTGTKVTTDYDAYGKHGIPLYTAPQPVAREPVAWKHDCAALLTNDVELWIDACPHCGKPRNAPQPVEREPLTDEAVDLLCKVGPVYVLDGKVTRTPAQYRDELKAAQRYGLRQGERAHGIGGQHGVDRL